MPRPDNPNTPMHRLVERLARLPGIGTRSAQRMAMHLLKAPLQEAEELAGAITDLKRNSRQCSLCSNLTQTDPCPICSDPSRDHSLILVVEEPNDVASFEATGFYRGLYHVLMGRLSPLEGVGPGELMIDRLIHRVKSSALPPSSGDKSGGNSGGNTESIREVILGTHPTLEGDGTALYLARELSRLGVKVSRLARGLPTGYSLDNASKAVLADAIQERKTMDQ